MNYNSVDCPRTITKPRMIHPGKNIIELKGNSEMKKIISLLLVLVMVVSVFAGCGSQTAPETTAAPTEAHQRNGTLLFGP